MTQKNNTPEIKSSEFLPTNQASKYLGVSTRTLKNWRDKGQIPYYQVGERKIYFKISDLDAVFRPKVAQV